MQVLVRAASYDTGADGSIDGSSGLQSRLYQTSTFDIPPLKILVINSEIQRRSYFTLAGYLLRLAIAGKDVFPSQPKPS